MTLDHMRAAALLVVAACGADDAPLPSCQQAIGHFYGVGCALRDIAVIPPAPISQDAALLWCNEINIAVPSQCTDAFGDLLYCFAGLVSPDCDCSREFDALYSCE